MSNDNLNIQSVKVFNRSVKSQHLSIFHHHKPTIKTCQGHPKLPNPNILSVPDFPIVKANWQTSTLIMFQFSALSTQTHLKKDNI